MFQKSSKRPELTEPSNNQNIISLIFKLLSRPFYLLSIFQKSSKKSESNKKIYRIGGYLAGKTLMIENGFLSYQSIYASTFQVSISDIKTVTVDNAFGWGKAKLKIIGNGTDLASIKLPFLWANNAQDWILKNK